jgi:hypothetical protein
MFEVGGIGGVELLFPIAIAWECSGLSGNSSRMENIGVIPEVSSQWMP